jgi:hypothetical protein
VLNINAGKELVVVVIVPAHVLGNVTGDLSFLIELDGNYTQSM